MHYQYSFIIYNKYKYVDQQHSFIVGLFIMNVHMQMCKSTYI
jgi:hypothetical protein